MTQSKFNRRNFLRAGMLGATGAMMAKVSFAGNTPNKQGRSISPETNKGKIISRTLGRTGIVRAITRIFLGKRAVNFQSD